MVQHSQYNMDTVQIAFYVFIQIFFTVMANGVSVQGANFHLSTHPLVGWLPLQPVAMSVNSTRISCAVKCMKKKGQCYSFVYNRDSRLCTLGAKVSRNHPAVTADQGQLYIKDVCEATEGFELWENHQVSMCVFINLRDISTEFDGAEKACKDMDTHLVSLKTTAKFDLFKSKMRSEDYSMYGLYFWIGMDDRDNEGQFVWTFDKTPVEDSLISYMFPAGNPDDTDYGNPNADCVRYVMDSGKLLDTMCSKFWSLRYVCEKLP